MNGWKRGSEIFFTALLIYNSLISLAKHSQNCEFISWHENQITNRSFSLAITYVKRNNLSDCTLSSFNGSLFTQQTKRQFLPLKSEFEIGFWGEKYFVQDKGSLKEMKSYLKKEYLNINLKLAPSSMLRINTLNSKNLLLKKLSREITIIHSCFILGSNWMYFSYF